MSLNELSLFTGAGGGLLASRILGWNTVCGCEIDPYARDVLLQRQRDGCLDRFPIWDDITTFDGNPWRGKVDIVTGGFPCQDISCANHKASGLSGERSGLFFEMLRVVQEARPTYIFAENSPMLRTRGLNTVVAEFTALGYDVRWCVLGAHHVGAPHKRDRMWIFAYNKCHKWAAGVEQIRTQIKLLDAAWAPRAWAPKPTISRMDDWMADRLDRIRCIGNGQVPHVAVLAWKILSAGIH